MAYPSVNPYNGETVQSFPGVADKALQLPIRTVTGKAPNIAGSELFCVRKNHQQSYRITA
jgi:hypothetical protein